MQNGSNFGAIFKGEPIKWDAMPTIRERSTWQYLRHLLKTEQKKKKQQENSVKLDQLRRTFVHLETHLILGEKNSVRSRPRYRNRSRHRKWNENGLDEEEEVL